MATAQASAPHVKAVAQKHVGASLSSAIHVAIDAAGLAHSKPGLTGMRSAETEHEEGMGGCMYTRDEIEALTGAKHLRYVNWLGQLSIPIIDSTGRIIAVLGGMPRDPIGWKVVTDGAAKLFADHVADCCFTPDQLHHRRAQEPYPSISRGVSHGGGQTEPGELCNNAANTHVTDEMLQHEYFQHLAGFANCLFAMFAPLLFAFYQAQMALIAAWCPSLRWNFARSVFAACTFNFGPHAITVPHLDFGNLSWGWCAITALGDFDPDLGGHLILWDLRLAIQFLPGSTILILSAIVCHSNLPVSTHERRYSFTQYTAGGLFRWIRNGYKTDEAFEKSATQAERAGWAAEDLKRWEEGIAMYHTRIWVCLPPHILPHRLACLPHYGNESDDLTAGLHTAYSCTAAQHFTHAGIVLSPTVNPHLARYPRPVLGPRHFRLTAALAVVPNSSVADTVTASHAPT
ncbi:hypothetical protein B0H17DRAFT_1195310 [Mycena rosella]|uniref:Uncharacterized protein n=1 Tax=Mycena rosella TaxID=1033263 RepID=A0AAD7DXU9_MYCRO|nr:hypothetical protein B0H17DRAFT_1195310 [Mycena rosella]